MTYLLLATVVLALIAQLGQAAALPQDLETRAAGPALVPTGTSINGWTSIGCYQDTYGYPQILQYYTYSVFMTVDKCMAVCSKGGYTYMGLSNGQYCYCDNAINYSNGRGFATTADKCAVPCGGDWSQNCGDYWTNAMYMVTSKYQAAQASSSASVFSATSLAASSSASAAQASSLSASISVSKSASISNSIAQSASAAASVSTSVSISQSISASVSMAAAQSVATSLSVSQSIAQSISASASNAVAQSIAASISASQSIAQSISASVSNAAAQSVATSLSLSQSVAQSLSASASMATAQSLSASVSISRSLALSASVSSSLAASLSSSAAAVYATAVPGPWVAMGSSAIAEGNSGRALTGASTSSPDMSYSKCLNYCASKSFAIAGLEFGTECYCGNALVNGASLTKTSSQGNMPCGGSSAKICGGPDALTLFAIPSKINNLSADLTAKAASLPAGWAPASTTCIAEGQHGRALNGAATASDDMTPSKCASFCASQGFRYAGVEYTSECHCGNDLSNGASLSGPSSQCNMGCAGDSNVMCGGYGALSLYTNPSIAPPVTASNTPTVSGSLPAGWSAASTQCIKEVSGRALTGASIAGDSMTVSTCLSFCQARGFQLAGLEYGSECYCADSLTNGATLSQSSNQCNMPCASDATSSCGGPNAIQLYSNPSLAYVAPPPVVAPAPVVINGFTSSGCIQEVAGRALTSLRVDYADMTIEKCTAACARAGYKLAGVEYGQECYCSSSLSNGASTSLVSGQCVMTCPGNSSQTCGGPNAIQLYTVQ